MNKQIIYFIAVIIFLGLSACNTTNKGDNPDEDTTITEIDTIQIINDEEDTTITESTPIQDIDEDVDITDNNITPKLISEYNEDEMISTISVEYKGKKIQLTRMEGGIYEYDKNTAQPMMTEIPKTAEQIFYGYYAGLAACYYVMETEVDFIIFEATIWEGEDEQIVEEMWKKEK